MAPPLPASTLVQLIEAIHAVYPPSLNHCGQWTESWRSEVESIRGSRSTRIRSAADPGLNPASDRLPVQAQTPLRWCTSPAPRPASDIDPCPARSLDRRPIDRRRRTRSTGLCVATGESDDPAKRYPAVQIGPHRHHSARTLIPDREPVTFTERPRNGFETTAAI